MDPMDRNGRLDRLGVPPGRQRRYARGAAVVLFGGALLPGGQMPSQSNAPHGGAPTVTQSDISGNHEEPGVNARMQEQLADRRNSDRQKQLVADTEKLFTLAEQLRNEVAKSNKDQLSVPVVKKSEEIEKLAKAVKEKMRGY